MGLKFFSSPLNISKEEPKSLYELKLTMLTNIWKDIVYLNLREDVLLSVLLITRVELEDIKRLNPDAFTLGEINNIYNRISSLGGNYV